MIDIMMAFWGDPDYLYQAVRSVRRQTSGNWRLTVVDDCYPEDVSPFFDSLDDPRVRYMRNDTNLGIIGNFRRCQELSEGDYTVFMGCDDLMLPRYVEVIESAAAGCPGAEMIQPRVGVIDAQGQPSLPLADRVKGALTPRGRGTQVMSGESLASSLLVGDWLYWPSIAFETHRLKEVAFLDDYEIILDLGLVLDLVRHGARLVLPQKQVFAYRRHGNSLSSTTILDGPRFDDERRFFETQADLMDQIGWHRAARTSRMHVTSRAHAATMIPGALRRHRKLRPLLRHMLR